MTDILGLCQDEPDPPLAPMPTLLGARCLAIWPTPNDDADACSEAAGCGEFADSVGSPHSSFGAWSRGQRRLSGTACRGRRRTRAPWQRWLSPSATFILETRSGPRGLAAGVPDASDPALVSLMAMWVHPDVRGSGAADMLVEAVIGWAHSVGAGAVLLDVIEGNDRARRLYERHGFEATGQTTLRARDGALEVQMARRVNEDS